jgi:glycosyltransferase involved in cell wall biosynthesis
MNSVPTPSDAERAPLVSVSMLTYHHEAFIEQAIASVMAQETDFEFELLIGEDCSSDRTRDIVQECARAYPTRIRLILPERNLGGRGIPLLARTLRACRGEFIARLDGDDYWSSPTKLQRQVAHLRAQPGCTMCFHNVLRVVGDELAAASPYNPPQQREVLDLPDLFERCVVGSCSPLIRRESILPLPLWFDELPLGDWPLYMLAARTGSISYMPEIMGVYRVHRGGLWSGASELAQARVMVEFLERVLPLLGVERHKRARRAVAYRRFRLAKLQARAGDLKSAQRQAWRSLRSAVQLRRAPVLELVHLLVRPYLPRWRRGGT